MSAFEELKPFFQKQRDLRYLISLLNYDIQTSCPKLAIGEEGELLSHCMGELAAISKDPKFVELVKKASTEPLNPIQSKKIKVLLEEISFLEKIPLETYLEHQRIKNKSNEMWRIYKAQDDFASYLPYWEKAIEVTRKEAELKAKPGQKTRYDACLDSYEPGETEEEVDAVFGPLKEYLIKKVKEAAAKQKATHFPQIKPYPIDAQRHLSYALLNLIDYDLDKGCLRESAHPFSDCLSQNDARVTTSYDEEDYRNNLFTIIHEGGHCIEFQNWPQEVYDDYAEGIATAAICETHSRFYENIVGRSREFAPHLKKLCAEHLDPKFLEMDDQDFHNSLNQIKEGNLIRCDADELTYSLHIIIRYEIERDLINGAIECRDVPEIWKRKYRDYLGVEVTSDRDGCLQDVHWTDGEIGYFPSYALGNIYGAQILNAIKKDLPYAEIIRNGEMGKLREWFAKNDFAYDYLDPKDWIAKVTGEDMNPKYFIEYLESKF